MKIGWLCVRRAVFVTFAVTVALLGSSARAEPRAHPRDDGRAETRPDPRIDVARQHYLQGNAYYKLDRFREALSEYEQAYIAKTDPSFLYNIAQCQRLMGNRVEALKYYRRFLKDQFNSPNAPVADQHIRDLETSLQKHPAPSPSVIAPQPAALPPPTAIPPEGATGSSTSGLAPAPAPTHTPAAPVAPAAPTTHVALNIDSDPAAGGTAPAVATVPSVAAASQERDDDRAFYTRPWFWGAVGAVVLGGILATVVLSAGDQCDGGRVCM